DRCRGVTPCGAGAALPPSQLASLWPKRQRIGRRHLLLGSRAWSALRALTPEAIEGLMETDTGALPFLKPALQRHLQELPWTTDGLSLSDPAALAPLLNL